MLHRFRFHHPYQQLQIPSLHRPRFPRSPRGSLRDRYDPVKDLRQHPCHAQWCHRHEGRSAQSPTPTPGHRCSSRCSRPYRSGRCTCGSRRWIRHRPHRQPLCLPSRCREAVCLAACTRIRRVSHATCFRPSRSQRNHGCAGSCHAASNCAGEIRTSRFNVATRVASQSDYYAMQFAPHDAIPQRAVTKFLRFT